MKRENVLALWVALKDKKYEEIKKWMEVNFCELVPNEDLENIFRQRGKMIDFQYEDMEW
jgi:hypothetical protein